MADPEEKGLPAETPAAETPEPVENAPAEGTPATTPEPEATPAPAEEPTPEPAKPSLEDASLDSILEREDVKRWGQSISDRAASRAESKFSELQRKQEVDAAAAEATKHRQSLVEDENFDQIGREEVAKSEANSQFIESLATAGEAIGAATAARYTQELGEEAVDRIVREHDASGGSIIDLNRAFAEEATKKAVSKATESAVTEAEARFDEKLEAFREEQGVARRSEEAEDTGPVDKISGTPPTAVTPETEKTWETEVDRYNAGDITWEEMEPFQIAHDKEIGGRGMRG